MDPSRSAAPTKLFVASLIALALACVANMRDVERDVPSHGWWDERGPVVPHETFPADCSLCHTGDDWETLRADFSFDHAAETGVILEGAHQQAECLRCHNDRGSVAVFAAKGCAGCHEDIHRGRLGTDCAVCHEPTDWGPNADIQSHQGTRFPLTGAHAAVACWRCHEGAQTGNFSRLDTDCEACHQEDLATAVNPDHVSAGFVNACDRCHIPTTWTGAGFSHSKYPLTGAHVAADCSDCHTGGVFAATPNDCYSCHTMEYNTANDPPHVSSGIPTSCEDCHTTFAWEGATFHRLFKLNGSPHGNLNCTECHTTPMNFRAYSCIDCHDHREFKMAQDHDEVSQTEYMWSTPACIACHPTGENL